MALTPNNIYQLNDIEIKEHLIPDGAVWKDDTKAKNAGFSGAGAAYKANVLLGRGSGKVSGVVVHNTGRGRYIGVRCTEDGDVAEVYTRACYPNENLNSARVHLFLSEIGCWQSLRMGTGLVSTDPLGTAEVAWSTGDGTYGLGNNNCIAIECCMDDTTNSYNSEIEARAAKIIAYLLYSNSLNINQLYTHTYFVNNMNGDKYENVDTQNTHKPSSGKYCPIYILPHWATFKAQVKAELAILNGDTPIVEPTIYVGDHAYLTENALFTNGKTPEKWVYSTNLLEIGRAHV